MDEGTKFSDSSEVQFDVEVSDDASKILDETKATKIGEVSDFEKDLLAEQPVAESVTTEPEPVSAETTDTQEAPVQETPEVSVDESDESNLFADAIETSLVDYQEGDVVKGTVRSIEKSGLLVDISYKSDGFVPNSEFSDSKAFVETSSLKEGDEIDVFIEKLETKEGYTLLSCKKAEYELVWKQLSAAVDSKTPIEVKVLSSVRGGVVAVYSGIRGFIPLSHLSVDSKEALDSLVQTNLSVIVLSADEARRKVIFSNRLAQKRTLSDDAIGLMQNLDVGQVHKGTVSSIKDFGVFIDIGGVEGLAHISELSWSRVTHPSEILSEGQEVDVFILGVDREKQRISFGLKQLQEDPWAKVPEKYTVGQVLDGVINRIVPFGAFVQLEPNLEGLIHISEFSDSRVHNIRDIVNEGDAVKVKIIRLQPDEQKIGLSLKNLLSSSDTDSSEEAAVASKEDEAPVEPAEEAVVDAEDVAPVEAVEEVVEESSEGG